MFEFLWPNKIPVRTLIAHAWKTLMLKMLPNTKFHSHITGNANMRPTRTLKITTIKSVVAASMILFKNGMSSKSAME